MSNVADVRPSRVFISHAGLDAGAAARLARDLDDRGVQTFVDTRNIRAGDNVVLAINRALAESDYFLLLWSRHCADRWYVEEEFAAALAREASTRRVFVFIVRLDSSSPPALLAARRHLDAFAGWDEMVTELVDTWSHDRAAGPHVLPAPHPVIENGADPVVVYVRNRSLSVVHVLAVPSNCVGRQFDELVRAGLALPERVTEFDGRTGVEFHYQLSFAGDPLPAHDTLESAGVVDYSTVDLEVRPDLFGPDGPIEGGSVIRAPGDPMPWPGGGATTLALPAARNLVRKAFAHLAPGRR